MTDPSTAERLAALQARSKQAPRPAVLAESAPQTSSAEVQSSVEPTAILAGPPVAPPMLDAVPAPRPTPNPAEGAGTTVSPPSMLRIEMPWTRVVTGGASVVSFAAMVVAMGPLVDGSESVAVAAEEEETGLTVAPQIATPVAPQVTIEVLASVSTVVGTAGSVSGDAVLSPPPSAEQEPATPAPTAAPVVDSPASTAPTATVAPAAAPSSTQAAAAPAPTIAPPATSAPTTAPPATPAPTTAVPTNPPPTAPPQTAPPRTDGSG